MYSPFHKFEFCRSLEEIFLDGAGAIALSDEVIAGHRKYHMSLRYKLDSAKHYLSELDTLLNSNSSGQQQADMEEILFHSNRCLDGFFHACHGALDLFAKEIYTYFGMPIPGNSGYFSGLRRGFLSHRAADPFAEKLKPPLGYTLFNKYRNTSTHEQLIADQMHFTRAYLANAPTLVLKIPLPDDPTLEPPNRTYANNPNALSYCEKNLKRVLSRINIAYREVIALATAAGSMPL